MVAPEGVKGAAAESGKPLGRREIQGSVTVVWDIRCAIAGGPERAACDSAFCYETTQKIKIQHINGGIENG